MRSWLFGVVVHPWMTQDPEGFVWLAQVLRQRGRELSRGWEWFRRCWVGWLMRGCRRS
ncbi:Uncharacterised protein [Dermatophilus congolensis]|uniref:Uncharacterized protein n=1 Tax=Dermatophilus congolensis TaxID=1863 RepID=A0AA46GZR5_9MICO|nr:Uncharacterised protein [Dermatophilus congolensis]